MDSGNTVLRLINAKIKYNGIVHFCKIYNFSPGSVKLRLDKNCLNLIMVGISLALIIKM